MPRSDTIDFDAYVRDHRREFAKAWMDTAPTRNSRTVRRKPRARAERELLDRLATQLWSKAISSREIEMLGKGRYRWNGPGHRSRET